jgi:single-stranded-DNA-specific exonuclease
VGGAGAKGNGADLLQGQPPAPPCAPPPAPPPQLPRQRWIFAEPHPAEAAALSKAARLPQVLAELLVARGVVQPAEAFTFLNPELAHLHDPQLMLGMNAAVARLEQAIAQRELVLLYGDYDVDGATAVVLLKTAIEMLGGMVRFHVPHRLHEGYGLQSSVLEAACAEGVRLVITVDTGMRAFAEAETARRLGLDLIITDHHLLEAGERVPPALAILNPNQTACGYPEKFLCGAGIAMKLAQALLEGRDRQRTREKTLPSFLKMAALATIADAVPLKGENRVVAAIGLRELRHPAGAGLCALFAAAALDPTAKPLTGFDVAFRLAPRINAAGRMDVASDVVELFTTRDRARAAELAAKLERLNHERRETEAVALAVVERTAKPAIVISVEEGVAYGSGRSVDGFHLLNAMESCADLFTRFGGHAFAVGFALPAAALPELKRRLRLYAEEHLAAREPERLLRIHAELPLNRITPVLAGWLRKLEPFGHGNPEPVFVARRARLLSPPRILKERHLRLELAQESVQPPPLPGTSGALRAVGWDLAARSASLGLAQGTLIDLAYRIRENTHPEYGGLEAEIAGIELV